MAKCKIIKNKNGLNKLKKETLESLSKTSEAIKTDIIREQIIPFDQGSLQESLFIDTSNLKNGEVSISVSTPYARRLYFHPEYNFQKVNNPNAQGKWFEPWINGRYKNFAKETFNKLLK